MTSAIVILLQVGYVVGTFHKSVWDGSGGVPDLRTAEVVRTGGVTFPGRGIVGLLVMRARIVSRYVAGVLALVKLRARVNMMIWVSLWIRVRTDIPVLKWQD